MIEMIPEYWWLIFIVFLGLMCWSNKIQFANDQAARAKAALEQQRFGNSFVVNLPKQVDFTNASVTLTTGLNYHTQYAGTNGGPVTFFLPSEVCLIDMVKVRTAGGKQYNYTELVSPGYLNVQPIVCYDCDLATLFK